MQALTKLGHRRLAGIPEARFMNVQVEETTDDSHRAQRRRACRTGAPAGRRGRGVRVLRGHFRHRRRRDPGAGVLRMLPARWRAAGGADAALHRHLARHHHPDLDPLVSGALRPWRGRSGHPQAVVGADRHWRDRRQRHRALRAGAAVQDRVRDGRMVRRRAAAAGARRLEARRQDPDRAVDARSMASLSGCSRR